MMLQKRLVALVVLVLMAINAPISHAGAAAARQPDPKGVNVRLKDLPYGFTVKTADYETNATAAREQGVSNAYEAGTGRMLSYQSEYDRPAIGGVDLVLATTELYDVPAHAARMAASTPWVFLQQGLKPVHVSKAIGTNMAVFKTTKKEGRFTVAVYGLSFSRGRYAVFMVIAGFAGTLDDGMLLRLGRLVDGRIQRQHGYVHDATV